MDQNTSIVLGASVVLVALVAIFFFRRFKQRGELELKGPGGIGLKAKGSNDQLPTEPALRAGKLKAGNNLRAVDHTGRGMNIEEGEAGRDLSLDVRAGQDDEKQLPKG